MPVPVRTAEALPAGTRRAARARAGEPPAPGQPAARARREAQQGAPARAGAEQRTERAAEAARAATTAVRPCNRTRESPTLLAPRAPLSTCPGTTTGHSER